MSRTTVRLLPWTVLAATLLTGCATGVAMQLKDSKEQSTAAVNQDVAPLTAPLIERKETFIGTGYAVISVQNHRLPSQQRLLAIRASKLEAYRALAEQVYGQYLDATTTVADMVVMSDSFRSKVEGVIYGAVLVSITPVSDDTYETTLSLDRDVVQSLRALYLTQIAAKK